MKLQMILVVFFKINILNACGSLGPGSAVGEKGKKTGSNRKNIGEGSEPSGGLGRLSLRAHFFSLTQIFFPFFPQCGAWFLATRTVVNNPFQPNFPHYGKARAVSQVERNGTTSRRFKATNPTDCPWDSEDGCLFICVGHIYFQSQ